MNKPTPSQIVSGTKYHEHIAKTYQTFVDLLRAEITNPNLDALTKARYEKELLEEDDKLKYKRQALDIYLQRASAWNVEWETEFKAMNQLFDATLKKGEAFENKTPNLQGVLNVWKTATESAQADNEFRYRIWATIEEETKPVQLKKNLIT